MQDDINENRFWRSSGGKDKRKLVALLLIEDKHFTLVAIVCFAPNSIESGYIAVIKVYAEAHQGGARCCLI